MDANELRALQAPLKKQYRERPETANTPARAEAILDLDRIACRVRSWVGETSAGLHPATGGDGSLACSADMATGGAGCLCRRNDKRSRHSDGREASGRAGDR